MKGPTHAAFSILFYFGVSSVLKLELSPATLVIAGAASALPEVDHPGSYIGSLFRPVCDRIQYHFGHRTITHSLIGWLIFTAIFAPLIVLDLSFWLAVSFGVLSHLFLDCFTREGVPWLWPYPRRYNVLVNLTTSTGSNVETVLMVAFVASAVALYPMASRGLMGTVYWFIADIDTTYNDYRQIAATNEAFLEGRFQDNFTREIIEGRYKIVDLWENKGKGYIVLMHDTLKTVGKSLGAHLYPFKVHLVPGAPVRETVSGVNLSGRFISDLLPYLDLTKEHYISGSLELEPDQPLAEIPPSGSLPLEFISSSILKVRLARWRDLAPLSSLKVKSGYVSIRHILGAGEQLSLSLSSAELLPERSSPAPSIKMEFEVASLSDLFIKEGDSIEEGQLIGRKNSASLIKKRAEVEEAQERYEAGLISEQELKQIEQELSILERQHEVRAKASGVVKSLEIKGINDAVQVTATLILMLIASFADGPQAKPAGDSAAAGGNLPEACPAVLPTPCDVAQVIKGIDGDTIDVMLKGRQERIRMIGVDTPETVHPSKPVECYGPEASAFTKQLVGKVIYLTYGYESRDKYGRLLAYIWLQLDEDPDLELFNEELISRGYGRAYTKFNHPMLDRFVQLEGQARSSSLGLWGVCYGPFP